MTTEVALKLLKKYKSVRLYLHWPNVPTLTLPGNFFPRVIAPLITCHKDISKTFIASSLKFGQLIEDDE